MTVKANQSILIPALVFSILASSCASLRPDTATEEHLAVERESCEVHAPKVGNNPVLDLFYYVVYGVGSAFSGK